MFYSTAAYIDVRCYGTYSSASPRAQVGHHCYSTPSSSRSLYKLFTRVFTPMYANANIYVPPAPRNASEPGALTAAVTIVPPTLRKRRERVRRRTS